MAEERAEEALKKLAAQLECGLCFEEYKDPKLLSCFHVFCKQCLERLVVQAHGQPTLQCPNCHGTTTLPSQGVSGLQSDFRMHNLFEIRDVFQKVKEPQQTQCENCENSHSTRVCQDCSVFLCQECAEIHQKWKSSRNHKIVTVTDIQASADVASIVSLKRKLSCCQKHPENICKMYCETCSELICSDCTIRLHQGHQYDLISDTFPKHKEEIIASLEPVKHHLAAVKTAFQALDKRESEISDQKVATETDIDEQFNQLQDSLEKRRTELKHQLDNLTQHKLKTLAAQRDQVELLQTQLASCLEYVEGSLKTGTQGEILGMKAHVLKHIQQMTAEFKADTLVPAEEADMLLISDDIPDLNQACCEVADVVEGHVLCNEKSYISGEGMKTARVGEPITVTFHAIDRYGKECRKQVTQITSELVSCTDTTTIKCQVRREGKSKYEIQYQPATRGKHQLHIMVDGKSIKGSPYTVVAIRSFQSLGKPVRIIGNIKSPYGIATNSKGEIIVVESGANCVSIFTREGKKIRSFGKEGAAHGQFSRPWGIAVVEDDSLIVVDHSNHRIQKFTSDGSFITSVGTQGSTPFQSPTGITYNQKTGKVYILECDSHRVQILNRDLTLSSTFSSQGNGNEILQSPFDIATDSDGNVYITHNSSHCVEVFTPEGKFLRKFGSQGSGDGQLFRHIGIAIDCNDTVYIIDTGNCQVSLFTTQGQFLNSFRSRGSAEGQFIGSCGITVHDDGSILISESVNNRIQIF